MDQTARIASYLATENHREYYDSRKHDVDEATKFIYFKVKEFYWTLTRLAGLAHWHDGSRQAAPSKRVPIARATMDTSSIRATKRPRVLIDVTVTSRLGHKTGIQRVVREIARRAIETGDGLPVFIEDGRLVSYYRHPSIEETVEIADGDKFLMLDASWHNIDDYLPIMRRVSAGGGENIAGIHDIIPLLYPTAFSPDDLSAFQQWFEKIALASDAVICASKSTAGSFLDYVSQHDYAPNPAQRIGWWRLGADFESNAHAESACEKIIRVAKDGAPFFLSVGTLEPRKGYSVALSAFDKLWSSGVNARYVIVGRRGWQSRALERRICEHEEYGRRLFWLDDVDDAGLHHLYEHAHGLIFASFAEGFGLPLAEAAHHGLRVIASDIPTFREIAGDNVRFFDLLDPEGLADRIREALAKKRERLRAPVWTWRESTQALFGMIRADAYQCRSHRASHPETERAGSKRSGAASKGWQLDWSRSEHRVHPRNYFGNVS